MPTGTLTKKIHGHESTSTRIPPRSEADGAAADRDRSPDAERLRPLGALPEGRRHDRRALRARRARRRGPARPRVMISHVAPWASAQRSDARREEDDAGEEDLLAGPARSPARPPSRRKPPNNSV